MITAIDLFAGLGGFTEAARISGVEVVWAANHWPVAVEFHSANHPEVSHACQDLHQTNWHHVPPHDVLLASPACQGHSRAAPISFSIRAELHGAPRATVLFSGKPHPFPEKSGTL